MKRSPYLAPLSREHLNALILASCLKNGVSSNPKYPWPTSPEEQRDKILQMWEQEMHSHFQAEELYLFNPFHSSLSPDLQALTQELLQDHKEMGEMILKLSQVSGPLLTECLQKLGQQLEGHVRKEERVYYEGLQKEIPESELAKAYTQISELYAQRGDVFSIFTGKKQSSPL